MVLIARVAETTALENGPQTGKKLHSILFNEQFNIENVKIRNFLASLIMRIHNFSETLSDMFTILVHSQDLCLTIYLKKEFLKYLK